MADQMVTANRLADGAVVFLGPDGRWVERAWKGRSAPEGEAAAELLRSAEGAVRTEIVGPYLIDVGADTKGRPVPLRYRERIRAEGPSVPWLADRKAEVK